MQPEITIAGDSLLLGDRIIYVRQTAGWCQQMPLLADEILEAVKPEHRESLSKNLSMLHPSRELTLGLKMLRNPDRATSGSAIVLRRSGDGFIDPAILSDAEMHRVAGAMNLTPQVAESITDAEISVTTKRKKK